MTILEKLQAGLAELQIRVSDLQLNQFSQYLDLLEKWNKKFNLTAVRDKQDMVTLHLLDSLSIAKFIDSDSLIDVGTGAGLPGIPLAILYPQKSIVLVDSNSKKTRFCQQAILELKLKNVEVRHVRVEELNKENIPSLITSRAFTALDNMILLLEPVLSDKSKLLAMKGQLPKSEIEHLRNHGYHVKVEKLQVPQLNADRHLVIISGKSATLTRLG